jgi:hypothetical protein
MRLSVGELFGRLAVKFISCEPIHRRESSNGDIRGAAIVGYNRTANEEAYKGHINGNE